MISEFRKLKPTKRKNLDVIVNQPKPKCIKTTKNNEDFLVGLIFSLFFTNFRQNMLYSFSLTN